jgi:hypothetical protein
MDNPNQNLEEESTPEDGGEDNISVTREEFDALKKGVDKFFSEQGQRRNEEDDDDDDDDDIESTSSVSPIVKKLYFKETPEIKEVWDEVEEEALELGQDPIEYYESKKGWQLEAKARVQAREEKENIKNKIDSPDNTITKDTKVDFANITPEQIRMLDAGARDKYRDYLRKTEGGTIIKRMKG